MNQQKYELYMSIAYDIYVIRGDVTIDSMLPIIQMEVPDFKVTSEELKLIQKAINHVKKEVEK